MGEGYLFSAAVTVRAVRRMLASISSGTITLAQAFGTDFVLDIPGTKRYTTLPAI